jgi:adenosylcobinamide-GDP ribazoletransferase
MLPIGFLAALQFLTIVPPLVRRPFSPAELGSAVSWFPLVGLLLGWTLAWANYGFGLLFPPAVVAALILTTWVLATGALHLDGFLDCCDGLFGGHTVEARLRIMRDERVGAFAVIGGVLLLLVKFACLASLADRTVALLVAPTLGRGGMALAVVVFPYARAEGLGRAMKDHAGWRQGLFASALAMVAAALTAQWIGMIAFAVALLTTGTVAAFVLRRVPGLTGDVYGAVCEVAETTTLLVFVAGETA